MATCENKKLFLIQCTTASMALVPLIHRLDEALSVLHCFVEIPSVVEHLGE